MSAFANPSATLDQKLMEWRENSKQAKRLKDLEMAQRKELMADLFPDGKVGTNTHDLGNGWTIKGIIKQTVSIDEAVLGLVLPEIPEEWKQRVVKDKPSLVSKDYKQMPEDVRSKFDECIVVKPASPSLEIVPPKS